MITIDKSALFEYTLLPNSFVDYFLNDTDGDFIKVYLYLLRHSDTQKGDLEISTMCEALGLSDRKIKHALSFWEENNLLELFYVKDKLSGITFKSPEAARKNKKSRLSSDKVRRLLKEDKDSKQIVFLAESYFGRPLTPAEVGTLLYYHDKLGFSVELCDYLLEYCIMHDAKNMNYVNTVALAWHKEGITTPEMAKAQSKGGAASDSSSEARPKNASKNQFLNFDQHGYDIKELARKAKE